MQLPLDFGETMTLRAVPLTASFTFAVQTATVTLSVRRPGWGTRAIRQARSSLSLATAIKLMALQPSKGLNSAADTRKQPSHDYSTLFLPP